MKKRRWIRLLMGMVFTAIVVCGCGSAKKEADMESSTAVNTYENGYDGATGTAEIESEDMIESAENVDTVQVKDSTKIIRTVNLYMETLYFNELTQLMTQKATEYGGYVENCEVTNGGYYSKALRYGYYVVRIPEDKADAYLESMGDKGTIVSRSENLEDVTLQYVDTKSHIDMLKVEQERLMELMEKAESLQDILIIEERLTNIRYELESYESKMKVMDNRIRYTTIQIEVSEVEQISTPEKASMGKKIADGFMNSLHEIIHGFEALIVFLIARLPYLVLIGLLLIIATLYVKKKIKNK